MFSQRVLSFTRLAVRHCKVGSGASITRCQHTLPDLPYGYDALAPVIMKDIMEIHHKKHHATYVNNLNATQEKLAALQDEDDVSGIIALQPALKFNGGGHINHSIFWTNMSPQGGGVPTGDLADAINRDFGSFDIFIKGLSAATIAIQGSGWGWLGFDCHTHRLRIAVCPNQDPLQGTRGLVPLFGIDVWEHAYYLQYKNVRPDYVKAIFDVANWENVSERFQNAKSILSS